MGKHKHLDRTARNNDKAKNPLQSNAQRLKDLELENELIRIENEYLKKLDALVHQRAQRERNKRKSLRS